MSELWDDVWTSRAGRGGVVVLALLLIGLGGALYFTAQAVRDTCQLSDIKKVRMNDFVIYGTILMIFGASFAVAYTANAYLNWPA